jgi:hypothetical protein
LAFGRHGCLGCCSCLVVPESARVLVAPCDSLLASSWHPLRAGHAAEASGAQADGDHFDHSCGGRSPLRRQRLQRRQRRQVLTVAAHGSVPIPVGRTDGVGEGLLPRTPRDRRESRPQSVSADTRSAPSGTAPSQQQNEKRPPCGSGSSDLRASRHECGSIEGSRAAVPSSGRRCSIGFERSATSRARMCVPRSLPTHDRQRGRPWRVSTLNAGRSVLSRTA